MDILVEAALRDGLAKALCVDTDIATLPIFANIANGIKVSDNGDVDASSVSKAVSEMRKARPALFQADWALMSPALFEKREAEMREALRKPKASPQNEFRQLDAANLTDEEDACLRRHLGGSHNSWDRAVLQRALHRQHAENTPPKDAA